MEVEVEGQDENNKNEICTKLKENLTIAKKNVNIGNIFKMFVCLFVFLS